VGVGSGATESTFVEVGGARMHYLRAGEGRPLLLIHGIIGSAANWRWNIPALAEHRTVYALDLLGMGQSDRVPGLATSLEDTARRVLETMDVLGVGRVDVGAVSHGGSVAMMLAALAPERVRSLMLFAPANPYSTSADWIVRFYMSWLGAGAAALASRLPRWVQQIALGRMFGDRSRIPEGSIDAFREPLQIPGTIPHVIGMVRSWFADMEKLRGLLPRVAKTPTLLIWGDRDRAVSLDSGRWLERELGAELVVVRGGGHLVFEEFAAEANELMVRWLERACRDCP
jgi:pimeloyl-ACP methyl ester carboxylesterase